VSEDGAAPGHIGASGAFGALVVGDPHDEQVLAIRGHDRYIDWHVAEETDEHVRHIGKGG
jgi:hypothetical protein